LLKSPKLKKDPVLWACILAEF